MPCRTLARSFSHAVLAAAVVLGVVVVGCAGASPGPVAAVPRRNRPRARIVAEALAAAAREATPCLRRRVARVHVMGAFTGPSGAFQVDGIDSEQRVSRRMRACVQAAFALASVPPFRQARFAVEYDVASAVDDSGSIADGGVVAPAASAPETAQTPVQSAPPRRADAVDDGMENLEVPSETGVTATAQPSNPARRVPDAPALGALRGRTGSAPVGPGGPGPAGFTVEPGSSLQGADASAPAP